MGIILTFLKSGAILAIRICIIEGDFDRRTPKFVMTKIKITFGSFLNWKKLF